MNAVELQSARDTHFKWMVAGGVVMTAAVVCTLVLGAFAVEDHYQVSNLGDQLRNWNIEKREGFFWEYDEGDGSILQGQIDHFTNVGYGNLAGCITFLVVAVLGFAKGAYHYTKKKEIDGQIEPPKPMTTDQMASVRKKRMIQAAVIAGVTLALFVILASLAIDNCVKIGGLWDKWHKWHEIKWHRSWGTSWDPKEGPAIADKIASKTAAGWQEFGWSMGFLAIGLTALFYAVHQRGKQKEKEQQEEAIKAN